LEPFIKERSECTFEFVNVHQYLQREDHDTVEYSQAPKDYIDKGMPTVQAKYEQLKKLKMLVGEVSCHLGSLLILIDSRPSGDSEILPETKVAISLEDLLPYLEGNDNIMGYQAFGRL